MESLHGEGTPSRRLAKLGESEAWRGVCVRRRGEPMDRKQRLPHIDRALYLIKSRVPQSRKMRDGHRFRTPLMREHLLKLGEPLELQDRYVRPRVALTHEGGHLLIECRTRRIDVLLAPLVPTAPQLDHRLVKAALGGLAAHTVRVPLDIKPACRRRRVGTRVQSEAKRGRRSKLRHLTKALLAERATMRHLRPCRSRKIREGRPIAKRVLAAHTANLGGGILWLLCRQRFIPVESLLVLLKPLVPKRVLDTRGVVCECW